MSTERTLKSISLNVIVVGSVLAVAVVAGYAFVVPPDDDSYSTLYLTNASEDGGPASEYPTEFEAGETRPLGIVVENHEDERVQYTVVIELQQTQDVDNTTEVTNASEVERYQTALSPEGQESTVVGIQPTVAGEDVRLSVQLYLGEPPTDPSVDAAYREVHLWITVQPETSAGPTIETPADSTTETPTGLAAETDG